MGVAAIDAGEKSPYSLTGGYLLAPGGGAAVFRQETIARNSEVVFQLKAPACSASRCRCCSCL